MVKRQSKRDTTMLLLHILRHIPKNRSISAPEIQKELIDENGKPRSLRTIQRHLNDLCELFDDIEQDTRSTPYGYRWKQEARGISIPSLTKHESLLLALAEQHLHNLLPASLMNSMKGFFEQSRNNLMPHTTAKREREWLSKVRVVSESQPLIAPKITTGVFETVSNALYANNWLQVDYKSSRGKIGKYKLMPLGIAQQGPRLYLVCRFEGYENERSLAMHRIVSATDSNLTFKRPKEFDLEKYDDDGRFGMGDGKQIHLSFRIEKRAGLHLLESKLSKDQSVNELEDCYEIIATVIDSVFLERWLLGFGSEISHVRKDPYKSVISKI